jgi:3-phosphoshikimate 1-carboxyvinyltransferase
MSTLPWRFRDYIGPIHTDDADARRTRVLTFVTPDLTIHGTLSVPGDKSISHRALMFGALANGRSRVRALLDSADVRATAGALAACGVQIEMQPSEALIRGVRQRGLRAPPTDLDCANSGTTARLLSGILAGHPFRSRLVGDASLSRRPMRRVAEPLGAMGASLHSETGDGLPMTITGGDLRGIDWVSATASAQVKSAILLAGYTAGVEVSVSEPARSRDHTERMMRAFGARLDSDGLRVRLAPADPMRAFELTVPGDPSSAAFFVALAMLAASGELRIPNVGLNPTRAGFLTLARRMGAAVRVEDEHDAGCEPVGTLICAPGSLRGISVEPDEIPSSIDELPLLAVLASRAEGETTVTGAAELRVKESDRIATVVANLRALGAAAEERPDGFRVRGSGAPLAGTVRTHGDHRIAMAFGILAAVPGNRIEIDDPACVGVSYPGFWKDLSAVTAVR